MATGKSTAFEAQAGWYVGGYGNFYIYARIELSETYDESTNKSNVSWTLYMKKQFAQGVGSGTVKGGVTVNGSTTSINVYMTIGDSWTTVTSGTVNNIAHDEDGTKTIYVSISDLTTDSYAEGFGIKITMGSQAFTLTDIPRGSKVRIGSKWYYVLIGNGTTFVKQKVKIGNGTTWKDY